jgi:hypothetical protein
MPTAAEAMYPGGPKDELGNTDKWDFRKKLMQDPKEREVLFRYTKAEVGGQGTLARQGFMESVVNRADAEKKTISQLIQGKEGKGSKYYPQVTHSRAGTGLSEKENAEYSELGGKVEGGSNVCNYCTGNASGSVGFAGGPMTAGYGGEKYGIEGWTGKWAKAKGYTGEIKETEGTSDQEWEHRAGMQGEREKQSLSEKKDPMKPEGFAPTNVSIPGVEAPSFGLPSRPQISGLSKAPEIRRSTQMKQG